MRAPTTIGEGTTLVHFPILAGGFFDALVYQPQRVDGLNGGTVERNVVSGAQRSRVMNCLEAGDYFVAHVINGRLQSGFRVRVVDYATPCH